MINMHSTLQKRSLRDADVRQSLATWLTNNHTDSQARVLHELKIPRPSARIDIALVGDELISYEIKSDVDSLARLFSQISACNKVFDRSYVVITGRHIKSCMRKIPDWWGIVIACEDSKGVFITQLRPSKSNFDFCIQSSLHMLTKAELYSIAAALGGGRIGAKSKRIDIINHIASTYSHPEVRRHIIEELRQRAS